MKYRHLGSLTACAQSGAQFTGILIQGGGNNFSHYITTLFPNTESNDKRMTVLYFCSFVMPIKWTAIFTSI